MSEEEWLLQCGFAWYNHTWVITGLDVEIKRSDSGWSLYRTDERGGYEVDSDQDVRILIRRYCGDLSRVMSKVMI